jgi:hypothetical protein
MQGHGSPLVSRRICCSGHDETSPFRSEHGRHDRPWLSFHIAPRWVNESEESQVMADDTADPFVQRFKQHPLHNVLKAILDAIAPALAEPASWTSDAIHRIQRLQRGVGKAQQLLGAADAALVGAQTLEEAKNGANALLQQFNQFKGNKNVAHLTSANDNLDNGVLPPLMRMPRLETPADVSDVFKSVDVERERAQSALKSMEEYGLSVRKTIDDLLANEAGIRDGIRKQEERLSSLVQQSDKAVAQFNERSATAERDRDTKFAGQLEAVRKSAADQLTESQAIFGSQQVELKASATAVLKEMESFKSQAAALLQVIGEIGVASPYDKTAREDRSAAVWLRVLAGLFFAGMVTTVVLTAVHLVTNGLAMGYMIFRFMTALIFAIPGYYFAREASKFQSEADRNRRLQLELASVGPFIEALDAQKKAVLREELARKYFSGVPVATDQGAKALDMDRILDIIKEALKSVRR